MTDLTLELLPDYGTVRLIPGLTLGNTEPSMLPSVPSVMGSFELVASKKYRYTYNDVRYMKFGYLLERDSKWESGELDVISDGTYVNSLDPATYTIPNLFVLQTIIQNDIPLGVELSVITDSLTVSSDPSFGIAYKITDDSPAVFPTLRMFLIKGLPLKEA